MNNKREQILDWQQTGHISNEKVKQCLEVSEANHSSNQWFEFIRLSLLWLGVLSLAFGVIFFFAYNWDDLSSIFKFGIVQSLILLTLIAYSQTKSQTPINTALLFLLALLIGALLALFGQTYQTGKDPWQLFAWWTLLVIPLAFISKSSSLWMLVLALANLTLSLYFQVRHGFFGYLFSEENEVFAFSVLNALAGLSLEMMFITKLIRSRYAGQLAIISAMVAFSWLGIYSIFEMPDSFAYLFVYSAWMYAIYYFYKVKSLDVMLLSSWVVSGIVSVIAIVGRLIDDDLEGMTFLIMGVILIGLSTVAGKWLMRLLKDSKTKEGENV